MNPKKHWAIFINNLSNKEHFINTLLKEDAPQGFEELQGLQGALFSKLALFKLIDEEERHGYKEITSETSQSLKSMSSGEQKKVLLKHLLNIDPDFLVLDNPFDNLDTDFQKELKKILENISKETSIVQLVSRKNDLLPFLTHHASLEGKTLTFHKDPTPPFADKNASSNNFNCPIPPPLHSYSYKEKALVRLRNVSVNFDGKPVLQNINWEIKRIKTNCCV